MTDFYGHKNVLIKQHETDQSCILFYKARVCHSLWKIAGAVYSLVPLPRHVRSVHIHCRCAL